MARGDQLGRQWRDHPDLTYIQDRQIRRGSGRRGGCKSPDGLPGLGGPAGGRFPIYTEKVDDKNLWSLLDTTKHQIPIPFNLMELMALYFGRDMMKVFKDTVFFDNMYPSFTRSRSPFPKNLSTSWTGPRHRLPSRVSRVHGFH